MMTGKKMAFIEVAKCDFHEECQPEIQCVAKAIKREDDVYIYVDTECIGCGKCVKLCKNLAITMI